MTDTEPGGLHPAQRKLIAPLWHTAVLIIFFVALGVAGLMFQKSGTAALPTHHPDVVPLYLSILVAEWALVYYVWQGLSRTGTQLTEVIGGSWRSAKAIASDVTFGLLLGFSWIGADAAWQSWFGPSLAKPIDTLLPESAMEITLWLVVSLSAGFCEETVFRGYLQRQLAALTGSRALAVVLQAAVFGAGHAYQGMNAAENTAAYGMMLGALALWRKNVRPSIVSHVWSDVFGGVLSRIM